MPRTRRSRKNTAKGCVDRNVPLKSYVCGTCHQGDDIFSLPGSQCVCMAIVGASFLSDAIVASSEGVDNILFAGNDLYLTVIYKLQVSGQLKSNSLLPDEVFDTVSNFFINSDCYLLSRKVLNFPLVGTVNKENDEPPHYCFQSAIQMAIAISCKVLITIGHNTNAMCVFHEKYVIFDSHSRDKHGRVSAQGKAIVIYYDRLIDAIDHIKRLSNSLTDSDLPFEIVPFFSSKIPPTSTYTSCV